MIQRYEMFGTFARMDEFPDGDYVTHADHLAEMQKAREELAEARRLAQWTPITLENLPEKGDEILSMPSMHIQAVISDPVMQFASWTHFGWTHFRPIAPPEVKP